MTASLGTDGGSRVRLNAGLYVGVVLLACAAVLIGTFWVRGALEDRELPFFWQGSADTVDGVLVAPGAGTDLGAGRGQVTPVKEATEEEQERVAAQIEAATAIAEAMLNLDHKDVEATVASVEKLATGDFLKQYSSASSDLQKLANEAQSSMTSTVDWAGLVAGDKDKATVIVATSGTVSNKSTDFNERTSNYRVQVELEFVDGRWLTQDFQFVELG